MVEFRVDVPTPEYVETDEQALSLLSILLHEVNNDPNFILAFDTETHAKSLPATKGRGSPDWMSDTITFWSLSAKIDGVYRRYCLQQQHFLLFSPLMENPNTTLVGWNMKYDAHISWNCNVNIWNCRVIDTMAMANLHDENRREYSLKACASDMCGLKMTKFMDLFPKVDCNGNKVKEYITSLFDLPLDRVSDYASYDAYATLKTFEWLRAMLSETILDEEADRSLWDHFLGMEVAVTEVLWRMERRGMAVDVEYLNSRVPELDSSIETLLRDINKAAGYPLNINSPTQLADYFFGDPGSPGYQGLGLEPIKMTKGGVKPPQPSTDKEVMDLLADSGIEIAKKIKECRRLGKIKSTYLQRMLDLANHYEDGRIHPNFNQFGARTGRFSTNDLNSQNLPRPDDDEWGIRRAVIAPPGKKLVVADLSQIEMRIMADQCSDKGMIKAILEGKDLHSFTVSNMVPGVSYEDVVEAKKEDNPNARQKRLKKLRQDCKAIGFGIIYGAGPPRIASSIDIPASDVETRMRKLQDDNQRKFDSKVSKKISRNPLLSEADAKTLVAKESIAAEKIESYFRVFPGIKKFMDTVPIQCVHSMRFNPDGTERNWDFVQRIPGAKPTSESGHNRPFGYVQTMCGRYRRLEDIDHSNYVWRSEAERQAINVRIQGSAADIIKASMLRIEFDKELNKLGCLLLNQVHDELVCEVPEENADRAAELIKFHMENPFYPEEALCVPIPVDLKICDNWAEGK